MPENAVYLERRLIPRYRFLIARREWSVATGFCESAVSIVVVRDGDSNSLVVHLKWMLLPHIHIYMRLALAAAESLNDTTYDNACTQQNISG